MKKKELTNDKEYKALSRLSLYIIISGWVFIGVYFIVVYEYSEGAGEFLSLVRYFLSTDESGIRFRALIFFAPLITTIIGFLVYQKARLFKKLTDLLEKYEYLSRTDMLTGLMNRGALIDALEYEIERSKRYGSNLSLILCDVDNFKGINDTFGHSEGDKALKAVSKFLRKSTRRIDIVGRYGGDEFMLILPETTVGGAMKVADRILLISSSELHLSRLSLSIGVTYLSATSDNTDIFIKRADDALYDSKKAGKNKITLIEPDLDSDVVKP